MLREMKRMWKKALPNECERFFLLLSMLFKVKLEFLCGRHQLNDREKKLLLVHIIYNQIRFFRLPEIFIHISSFRCDLDVYRFGANRNFSMHLCCVLYMVYTVYISEVIIRVFSLFVESVSKANTFKCLRFYLWHRIYFVWNLIDAYS